MAAPPPETIPSTRITATDPANPQTFVFGPYTVDIATAQVTLDRTVNGGLNSLALGSTLDISIGYSLDGGIFAQCGAIECQGGPLPAVKGVTQTSETFTVRIDQPFPANRTRFQVTAYASGAVRIAGTVAYT